MKKPIPLIPLILALLLSSTTALQLSNDNYAVEVLLNKPGTEFYFFNLDKLDSLVVQNNKYLSPSQYSQNLEAIFSQENFEGSTKLSLRLQLPTENSEINIPFINFISLIDNTKLSEHADFHQGWEISCTSQACKLNKQETELTIAQDSKNRYNILIESNELTSSGKICFSKYGNIFCVGSKLESDISEVLSHIGFVSAFNKLLTSYSLVNVGNKAVGSLTPATNLKPDWQEAMRQELVNLKKKNIIKISDKDIEEIALLAQQGKAGKNERMIYNSDSKSYDYHYRTSLPILSPETNSAPFTLVKPKPTNTITNPYYLVPLILTLFLIIIFVVFLIIGRVIAKRKRQKKIHPTGLLSQG